ncbi:2-oxoglutarate dehydrogenase complex dihydrolipoyllysine-residue succinyltransferase [Lewinella sp. W8]|uniref:2-oxoglutarate dehydrogenase complex dihydrolipoyllysine-residue succinyltransferase n=1 Tax=Lewinella sp. W8 TaxID=2528208 RepID=UPI001068AFC2|nr:2-oxoglutarate dehydrogenase complex dihydrolipoyllysine-residue succinyltransferase [Lewinella sp. W8]MTB52004.1 2-oxoglutarate dehydrogenase complex dihydrolipoyllysine-residue succinyltransferase [Lewinella sp. W8]
MSIVEMKVPVIGESVTEVTLSEWLKADGEYVELDEPICEFESDKATLEFPAEAAGKIIHVAAEGDDLEIGALVAKIDTSVSQPSGGGDAPAEPAKEETPATPAPAEEKAAPAPAASTSYATGTPSPAAGKILREAEVDPSQVNGSGRDGRITKEDAQRAAANKATAPAPAPKTEKAAPAPSPAPAANFSREERTEKMSRMRRTIATRLVRAKNETAMLTTFNEVDLSEVMALRKRVQEKFVEKYGVKLGFMSIFAKACAQVLMEMPDVNAALSEDGKSLIYHDYVDISFAVSTPTGLVVPPIKNIESLHFADIEKKLKDLAARARDNKLSIEEMQGGTFTITNGGVFGSMMSTPILNEPQSAILGMHNIIQRPVAVNGQVEIRPMMYLALSYDHRVIDGSSSVTFLVKVKQLLEDPTLLLLGL